MKTRAFLLLLLLLSISACGPSGSDQVPVAELPDPAIYALAISELPEIGVRWQQSYNQTVTEQAYKWSYIAYQAYQPGNLGVELASAFAVNNDVYLYEVDMSRQDLPQPPQALGEIQNMSWKSAAQPRRIGDISAVWKTSLGEMLTPVWWLEFYQGHAYVRISLFGFPDQIAPALVYELGDIVARRLPRSVADLRADAATRVPTQPPTAAAALPQEVPTQVASKLTPTPAEVVPQVSLSILSYTAPPGETGMVSYFDDTGSQLADGVIGSDDILADQGSGTAYEWVGWTELTDPVTMTFTLQNDASVAAVEIGVNHREGLGVFIPRSVTINGVSFELASDAVPNNQRGDMTFTGPFDGPVVTIVLHHRGRGWMLVDEVRFIAAK